MCPKKIKRASLRLSITLVRYAQREGLHNCTYVAFAHVNTFALIQAKSHGKSEPELRQIPRLSAAGSFPARSGIDPQLEDGPLVVLLVVFPRDFHYANPMPKCALSEELNF